MSRWWPDRLVIGLAPGRVDLMRLGRWPSRRVGDTTSLGCAPQAGEPAWAAALRTLDAALQHGDTASVTVVLSNHFVRHLVLPWQPELTRSAELDTLARLRFEQIHGAVVAGWTVRLADGGWGAPLLACAVDTDLLTGLREGVERHGLRLASTQGLLMASFNRHRRALGQAAAAASTERPAALALVEPGRLCLALLADGRWLAVASRRLGDEADVDAAIEQELAALQLDPASLDVLQVGGARYQPGDTPRAVRLLGAAALLPALVASPGSATSIHGAG